MNRTVDTSYRVSRPISVTLALFILLSTTACTDWLPDAHRLDIVQGNALKPVQVDSLQIGMPKADVRALLGMPVLADPFHDQRWDYIFRYLPGRDQPQQSRLTLFFEDDILIRIDDSDYIDPEEILPPPTIEE